MRIAIVSDIHANLAAFEAVIAHAKSIGYDKMVCLGDVVGYGPDPVECIDLVREHCEWSLLGNHDFATIYEPTNFNKAAAQAVFWTREQTMDGVWLARRLGELTGTPEEIAAETQRLKAGQAERDDFMHGISPRKMLLGRYICVHASPSKPVNEYLFGDDIHQGIKKLERNFAVLKRSTDDDTMQPVSAIVGHTHCPGFLLEESAMDAIDEAMEARDASKGAAQASPLVRKSEHRYDWVAFEEGQSEWTPTAQEMLPNCRFILNPGSVGQPRDRDKRSSYVMLQTGENGAPDTFTFHRVDYDIALTQAKIQAFIAEGAQLSDWLWQRLARGE